MQISVDNNLTYKIKILQYIGTFRCENIWNTAIISRWQSTAPIMLTKYECEHMNTHKHCVEFRLLKLLKCK